MNLLELNYRLNVGRYIKIQKDYEEKKILSNENIENIKTFDKLITDNIMKNIDFCIYFLYRCQEDIKELEEFYKMAYEGDKAFLNMLKSTAITTFMLFYDPTGFVEALKREAGKKVIHQQK